MPKTASVLLVAILTLTPPARAGEYESFKESAADYGVCYGIGVESPTRDELAAMKAACRSALQTEPDDPDLAKRIKWIDDQIKAKKR